MEIENSPKLAKKFACNTCHYSCSKESDYKKHIATSKHLKRLDGNNLDNMEIKKVANDFTCQFCNKKYNTVSGLWKHNKVCNEPKQPTIVDPVPLPETDVKILTNLVLEIVKSNADLQKQMMEIYKQGNGGGGVHNSNINSHNKTFNMQFFLNEQCKDAMNIMDFVNTFQLQFSDLERIGEVGYVEGISNIVINKLNEMDVYKRPIHCSDAKREIMYVKDKDVWEKENANNDKIRLALKHITKKNSDMIRPWANAHPGVLDSDHRLSDKYQEIIIEAMGGNSGTIRECETKIIKKISKMVLIDKGH